MSASKHLAGHSDLIMGTVAVADAERADALRAWRIATGSIPGPFEAWLAHRSLATLALRLERQEANARAVAERLRARDDVSDVRWPGRRLGRVLRRRHRTPAPTPASAPASSSRRPRASAACTPTPSAARAGAPTPSAEGFIRFNAGIEDAPDLVADLERALELSRP